MPYGSGPYAETHPDALATVATLLGMTPPAVQRCRVLELGCAGGSNLIPMALGLPEGRFVGLDFSPRQIADGRRTIDALGLRNIDLRVMDLLDFDGRLGEFDYIIGHGVFSWVPRPVQDKVLAICSAHLRPNGVAYVSYNTYPGWHSRGMVREMVLYHVNAAAPRERVRQAREFLEFLGDHLCHPTSPFAAAVQKELTLWRKAPDDCILYDPLSETNEPVYFHQFVGRASEQRLQFIAEAELWDGAAAVPADVRRKPECCPGDLVRCEQHLDFLRERTFRRSLLCHEGVRLNREPRPELIERFLLAARAVPAASHARAAGVPSAATGGLVQARQIVVGAGVPPASGPSVQQFRTEEGTTLSTSKPWVKAALLTLFDLWPRPLAFEELCRQARSVWATRAICSSTRSKIRRF
ncbi:MAG TPA: class I SAM-dependent methyltransferase [Pirellulales bacterium]|nr:class I SAM-dependent methyltransferase [Pirellulales bacterium]